MGGVISSAIDMVADVVSAVASPITGGLFGKAIDRAQAAGVISEVSPESTGGTQPTIGGTKRAVAPGGEVASGRQGEGGGGMLLSTGGAPDEERSPMRKVLLGE